MNNVISNYTPVNNTVTPYRYNISLPWVANTPPTFTMSTYVTNTKRAIYGYTDTSKITAIELVINSCTSQFAVASLLNAPCVLSLSIPATFTRYTAPSSYGGLVMLTRIADATTVCAFLPVPISVLLYTNTVTNITGNLQLTLINPATGASLSSPDYVWMNIDVIEYVSQI